MGDVADIQIVVAGFPADNPTSTSGDGGLAVVLQQQQQQQPQRTISPESGSGGDLDGLGDCTRSIVSYASSSIRRSTISYQQRQRRAQWKGIGSRCMWDAFRFSLFGLLLLVSGSIIVLVGYYSEFSAMEIAVNFNQTIFLVDPESQKRQKYSYSYIGPVLIGIGVFILIGVGVATMEMRDMTAKVFPLTKRTVPRRRHHHKKEGSKSKTKLTAEALGEMFQTPAQRIVKEMTANRPEDQREQLQHQLLHHGRRSFRTVATQTFRPVRSWPWSKLKGAHHQQLVDRRRQRGGRPIDDHRPIVWRSCQQLCTPSHQQTAIQPTVIFKRKRRYIGTRKLWIHSLTDTLAVSCPQLDIVS